MMLDLKSLVDMMSIGTLMAYMIVRLEKNKINLDISFNNFSVCVLLLHYKVEDQEDADSVEFTERDTNTLLDIRDDLDGVLTKLFNLRGRKNPTVKTEHLSHHLIYSFLIVVTGTAFLTAQYLENLENLEIVSIISLGCLSFLLFILIFCLSLQPRSKGNISFRVPFVPLIPCLAIFANIYLMMKLSIATWIRFFIWLFIGLLIYFFYGIRNSSENISSVSSNEGLAENDDDRTEYNYGTIQGQTH